jgi:hypothetical protein
MTESGLHSRGPEGQRLLGDRAVAAREAACAAAERYVRICRQCQLTIEASQELRAAAQSLREQLRDSVTTYALELRRDKVLPERVIVLVKSAIGESDEVRDRNHRAVLDDVVRWAVDAYYAA